MKLIGKLGLSFAGNVIALILADFLILGFMLAGATTELLMLALVLSVINIFIIFINGMKVISTQLKRMIFPYTFS